MTPESDFYVNLISNGSTDLFPENTPGQFFNHLPAPVELQDDFQVGLSEIFISNSFHNVAEGELWLRIRSRKRRRNPRLIDTEKKFVPPGLYTNSVDFLRLLNRLIKEVLKEADVKNPTLEKTDFFYKHMLQDKAILRLPGESGMTSLLLSPSLADILKFPQHWLRLSVNTSMEGYGAIDFHRDDTSIFVYTNCITPSYLRGTFSPLLRVFPQNSHLKQNSKVIQNIYDKIHYKNVATSRIQDIELLITKQNGSQLQFTKGYVIATLHFRRKKF